MKRLLSVFFVLTSLSLSIFAQFTDLNNYVTRVWTSSDGLPGNSVTDICQSKDGFMYFGTYEGLVRFDGYEFTTLNKYTDTNLNFYSARSVLEDSEGEMWIGSNDEGVQKLNKSGDYVNSVLEENSFFSMNEGLTSNSIRAMTEDKNHNVWIGTASGVCYINHISNSVFYPAFSGIDDPDHIIVRQLFSDTAGRIWLLGYETKSIYIYSGVTFMKYKGLDQFGDYIPSAIVQDKQGNFWIGLSQQGIVEISNGNIKQLKTGTILDYTTTQTIFCDENGALWFGTESGLVYYANGEFVEYAENNSIANASVQKIKGDREGNIWVATSTGGIGKISPGKFNMTVLNHAVNAICEGADGKVWVGADDGLYCYEGEKFVENRLTELCKSVRIRHVQLCKNGDVLVNCYTKPAFIRYSPSNDEIINWTTEDGLAGNKTRVSIETADESLYCGTTTGLSLIKTDGSIENLKTDNGLSNEFIMCLYEDKNDFVWVGTDGGGIFLLKENKVVRKITNDDGLAGNVIFKIRQDDENYFWICTGSGISRLNFDSEAYDEKSEYSIVNITTENGLGSDSIFQLIDDGNENFWMVSNRGVSSAKTDDFNAFIRGEKSVIDCRFYNENDGLKSTGANSTALSMKDKYGRIWFTMADGFAVYDPVKVNSNHVKPIIQMQEIKIDDEVITNFGSIIEIPAGTKHVSIKYTGLSFSACERNRFIYKLEGFDNDYSNPTAIRTVSYTNLKPGKYTFYVNVINGDGVMSDVPSQVTLNQHAFFYQLALFWVALGISVLLIVFIIFVVVIKTNKKKQLILETKIQMATVDLQIAKDESERLLRNILPVSIANKLKSFNPGESHTIAQKYNNVTVLFADIVGFTNTTSNHSPEEIVSSLNDLVTRFDIQATKYHVEKIKTIGDAYMAVCGAPEENTKHAETMLKFATIMYKELAEYNKTAKIKFRIRIGMDSGDVIAGVIGKNKFIYDIWGDTVNVASRMESNCEPMHVRMTESVVKNLEEHGYHYNYKIEEINVKGKGLMKTYELPNR